MPTALRPSIILTTVALLSLSAPARAQEVTRLPLDATRSLGVDAGLESAFIARATYAHRVDLGFFRDTRIFARFTMPFVTPDLGDWSIDGGLRTTPLAWGDLRLALLAGPVLRNSVNDMFSATATGIAVTVLFGYEGPRWGLSAEGGYEQILATNVRHSDEYRELGYAGAKDGWYAISGATARGGLRGGVRFGSFEIVAKAGLESTGKLNSINPPFYGTLGSSYAF